MINNINKKLSIIIVILLTLLVMPINNVNAEEIEPEIVRVGWFYSEGFQETDEHGQPYGYNYEYLQAIENNSNIIFEFVDGEVSDLFDQLKNGEIDMLGGINITDERNKDFLFSDIGYGYNSSLIVSRLDTEYDFNNFISLDGKKILIDSSEYHVSNFQELMLENDFDCELETSSDFENMLTRLDNGEVEFVVLDSLTNFNDHRIVGEYNFGNIYFIFNKKNIELKNKISDEIKTIKLLDNQIQFKLREKYFYNNNEIAFTQEEYAFINQPQSIVVGLESTNNTLSTYDFETSEFRGINYSVMKTIAEYTGLKFEYIVIPDDMTKIEALKSGFCDLIPGIWVSETTISDSNIILSSIYITDELTLVYKKGLKINSSLLLEIPSYDQGVVNYIEKEFHEWNIVNVEKNDIDDSLSSLVSSNIDGVLISFNESNYFLKMPKYEDLAIYHLNDVIANKTIAVRDDDNELISIINKSLNYLENHLDSTIASSLILNDYQLTFKEQILENSKTIAFIAIIVLLFFAMLLGIDNRRVRSLKFKAEEAKRQAIESDKGKSDFFSRMTHDMRTPLNATINYSKFGIEEVNNERDVEYFTQIKNSSEYLLALMSDILDMQHSDNQKLKLFKTYTDYYEMSNNVFKMMKEGAAKKNIDFAHVNKIPDFDNDRYQIMDVIRVKQILTNILSNAIKYTEKYGKIRWVSRIVNTVNGKRMLTFDIIDNGIGMSEEFQEHLYEPFSQEVSSHSQSEGGIGLGMSITKNLLDLMGGKIECISTVGFGTTFTIYIPVEFISREYYENMKRINDGPSKVILDDVRILAVEDNLINLKILTRILVEANMSVDIAKNGLEAIDLVKTNKYDIILMDIRMPVMNGLEASREIRKFNSTVPIIAVSANAFLEDINRSISAGMNAHIAKPINRKELLGTINKFIEFKK
jgi:signal transduction histidine kinase/BarA-like signal transduction histidine kinase